MTVILSKPHRARVRSRLSALALVVLMAGALSPIVAATPAGATGCAPYSCTILDAITAVSGADASDFAAWILGDFNQDGVLDLYGIKTRNTGSGDVEVHILSGASGYHTWLLHAVVPITAADAANFSGWALGDYVRDGLPDLYAIKTRNTGSGAAEVHILSGSSDYHSFALHAATPLSESDSSQNFAAWEVGTYGGALEPTLFGIKTTNTGSGTVEIHALSGDSFYHSFSLHTTTAFPSSGVSSFGAWQIGTFNADGEPDLYGLKTVGTGSGDVEVHVVSAVSDYATFLLHAVTSFSDSTPADYAAWALGDFNGAGVQDLYGIQTTGTGSGAVEVDIVNGYAPLTANCGSLNDCTPQSFADAVLAAPGIDAPVSGSNEAALEIWEIAEGGGAGCPGQAPNVEPWPYSAGPAGNPLNTTQTEPGSTNWNNLGGGIGVQIFHNFDNETCWFWGITATVTTLLNGFYGPILKVLLTPTADSYNQCVALARAVGSTPWGTGDFEADCSQLIGTSRSSLISPSTTSPAITPVPPVAPVPSASGSTPGASSAAAAAQPPDGQYSDGTAPPRYLISLQHTGPSTLKGSLTFEYQDGRRQLLATYTGQTVSGGQMIMVLGSHQTMSGSLTSNRLALTNCGAVLHFVINAQQCSFQYAG